MSRGSCQFGVIGLGVMGESLALNAASRGLKVAVYNRPEDAVARAKYSKYARHPPLSHESVSASAPAVDDRIVACEGVADFVDVLCKPAKILIMILAGKPVDATIQTLLPFLSPGDIIMDGGNSHFPDTDRRVAELRSRGIIFVGMGVSGGEEGALKGPSLMPGGNAEAWPLIKPILTSMAAEVPEDHSKCVGWIGEGGAGHYVKMVHNGIEYGDMQLICEAYSLLKNVAHMSNDEMAAIFDQWNSGDLGSYLIEITADILRARDKTTGAHIVDLVMDTAGQKGTGKWTAQEALEIGSPVTLIAEAVFARVLSALKTERLHAAKILEGPHGPSTPIGDKARLVDMIGKALYSSKVVSYAQGFSLMRATSQAQKWNLDYGAIAMTWRGGCIIRSKFLSNIRDAFVADNALPNLMLAPYFAEKLSAAQSGWREVAALAIQSGVPIPAISSALAYYDGYRSPFLPANLLQAQRDYFGAHTFERVDAPPGKFFHYEWLSSSPSFQAL
ncbi:NADP-dependent phosphogluconate dehydrogenase [Pelomyxa schiedti]|nr:NADP-dependent phosphogluconate dehydrogenase [Pelomyxa schiedti]